MKELRFDLVPAALSSLHQWVLWRTETRGDKPTKVPYAVSGGMAKSNGPETWAPFEDAVDMYERGGYDGIGFMFREGGGIVGIDLDGCRDPETLTGEQWARDIVTRFDTYAEVSPSQTGVKLFVLGKSPFEGGRKRGVEGAAKIGGKEPAIEVYDKLRYFAVTGWRVGSQQRLQERPEQLAWLKSTYFPELKPPPAQPIVSSGGDVFDRARKYLATVDGAISGQSGHNQTFKAACYLVLGFELPEDSAFQLLAEWNQKCSPPWTAKELRHKVSQAAKQGGPRGYLANQPLHRLNVAALPVYECPPIVKEHKVKTLRDATQERIESATKPEQKLVTTGVPDLDFALEGGIDFGEYVIFAARPSHGKSAVALQGVHHWTAAGYPCLFISQEMPAVKLGERALQYLSDAPKEDWRGSISQLAMEVDNHFRDRAPCYIVNDLASAEDAVALIDDYIQTKGVKIVVVDYAQILKGKGKDEREQVSRTSTILRQIATTRMVLMVALCQLSRGVEQRKGGFSPGMKDLKDSGQLEQDADVVVFQCWPHRLDPKNDPKEYHFYIAKNRNRGIMRGTVKCWFHPSRQMLTREDKYTTTAENPSYTSSFDDYNNGDGRGSF